MTDSTRATHEVVVDGVPADVFEILRDVGKWSGIFPPTVHSRRLQGDDAEEIIEIWAAAGEEMRRWESRRSLNAEKMQINFHQTSPAAPLGSMSGRWVVTPQDGQAHVSLLHEYQLLAEHADQAEWVAEVVDSNSRKELDSLKSAAESKHLSLTFDETIETDASPALLYEFLDRSDRWPERLPHVSALELVQLTAEQQVMTMTTATPDHEEHVTRSLRVCLADEGVISYKQTQPPALLTSHAGQWQVEDGTPVRLTSVHRITVNPDMVKQLLGDDATLEEAKAAAQSALSNNSRTTMRAAIQYASGT